MDDGFKLFLTSDLDVVQICKKQFQFKVLKRKVLKIK